MLTLNREAPGNAIRIFTYSGYLLRKLHSDGEGKTVDNKRLNSYHRVQPIKISFECN